MCTTPVKCRSVAHTVYKVSLSLYGLRTIYQLLRLFTHGQLELSTIGLYIHVFFDHGMLWNPTKRINVCVRLAWEYISQA